MFVYPILLYDPISTLDNIDEAHQEFFAKKGRPVEAIPPTKAAYVQHTRRAVYQEGYCWGQAKIANPVIPSPSAWGWIDPENWKSLWTTLPEASKATRQLLSCGCKKSCSG